ncbi:MAG: hypothetical protein CTY19_10050 [Methylomonas sp.]|nr:MAG: hypothetical protein CTY19_10050 [Methylomonas sp.]
MSLINQMLRDLEQRNQQTPSINQAQPLDIQISPIKPQPRRQAGRWLASLLFLTAAGWLFWQTQQTSPALPASSQSAMSSPAVKPAEPLQTPLVAAAPEPLQPQWVTNEAAPTEQPAAATNTPYPQASHEPQHLAMPTANPKLAATEAPTLSTQPFDTDHPVEAKAGMSYDKLSPNLKPVTDNVGLIDSKPAVAATPKTAKPPSINRPQQQAEKLYRQSSTNASRMMRQETLKEVLQLDPRHLAARQQLLQILVQEHANLALKQFLDESLGWFPDNLGFITTLAHYHVQQKNFAAAIETLERVDSFRINDPHYLALLAASHQQQQQFIQAQTVYQKLTQLQPEKAENWLGLGICADKLQQNDSAQQAYQEALAKNTLNTQVVDYINQRLSALTR